MSFAYPFHQDSLRHTDGKDQNPLAAPRRLLPRKGGSVGQREAFPEVQIPARANCIKHRARLANTLVARKNCKQQHYPEPRAASPRGRAGRAGGSLGTGGCPVDCARDVPASPPPNRAGGDVLGHGPARRLPALARGGCKPRSRTRPRAAAPRAPRGRRAAAPPPERHRGGSGAGWRLGPCGKLRPRCAGGRQGAPLRQGGPLGFVGVFCWLVCLGFSLVGRVSLFLAGRTERCLLSADRSTINRCPPSQPSAPRTAMPRGRARAARPALGCRSPARPRPVRPVPRRCRRPLPSAPALTGCPEAQATKLTVSASHTPRIIPAEPARRPPGAGHKGETGGRRRWAAPEGAGQGRWRPGSGPPRSFRGLGAALRRARCLGRAGCRLRCRLRRPPSAPSARRRRRGSQLNPAEIPAGLQHRLAAPPASGKKQRAATAGSRPSQIQASFPPSLLLRLLRLGLPSLVLPPSGKHEQRRGPAESRLAPYKTGDVERLPLAAVFSAALCAGLAPPRCQLRVSGTSKMEGAKITGRGATPKMPAHRESPLSFFPQNSIFLDFSLSTRRLETFKGEGRQSEGCDL